MSSRKLSPVSSGVKSASSTGSLLHLISNSIASVEQQAVLVSNTVDKLPLSLRPKLCWPKHSAETASKGRAHSLPRPLDHNIDCRLFPNRTIKGSCTQILPSIIVLIVPHTFNNLLLFD